MNRNILFLSPNGSTYKLKDLPDEIKRFVEEDPTAFYSLIIGSDSQAKRINGVSEITYVTAVVIYRKKRGARYFWTKEKEIKQLMLREKIYKETLMSLDLAEKLVPDVRKIISPANYDLEIHIDVGSLGQTRSMIHEAVGMVTGNGYIARTKPDSWGASSVADKHT